MQTEDWRLRGQEAYLTGVTLRYSRYTRWSERWDHDHCEFCFDKFSEAPDTLHEGYCTLDGRHWICPTCFADFQKDFQWRVAED